MNKPVAVLISDVHYSLPNLKLADAAMRMAIDKANALKVPLIVAGDLHDTKANLRGECIKAMRITLKKAARKPYVMIGNHDRINEKSEEHALHCLGRLVYLVDKPSYSLGLIANGLSLIPYQHDPMDFVKSLYNCRRTIIIAHQGVVGSNMGDYIQDKSAINQDMVDGLRIISGHYHSRQTIKLPNGGSWDYIGSPYTQSYGEANDPPKGFQLLYSDGSLEFIPTDLRRHVVINLEVTGLSSMHIIRSAWDIKYEGLNPDDLVWIKCAGPKELLKTWGRQRIADYLYLSANFRLDLIPTDVTTTKPKAKLSSPELIDSLIDSLTVVSDDTKLRLKDKWKGLCE